MTQHPALQQSPRRLDDYKPGDTFANRIELSLSGMHRPRRAGISGSPASGAESIVLSGMYEDDKDEGNVIYYAGHGGRHQKTGKQMADQLLDHYNLALMQSQQTGQPVRVIRGAGLKNEHAPEMGYRYEGLYRISDYWQQRGKSGFWIWMFKLESLRLT